MRGEQLVERVVVLAGALGEHVGYDYLVVVGALLDGRDVLLLVEGAYEVVLEEDIARLSADDRCLGEVDGGQIIGVYLCGTEGSRGPWRIGGSR